MKENCLFFPKLKCNAAVLAVVC